MPPIGWQVRLAFIAAACTVGLPTRAAEPLSSAAWKLEQIELVDGRTLEGILDDGGDDNGGDDDGGDTIAFTEVVRRPGRGMYLVSRSQLGRDRVRSIERLPAKEHDELAAKVREFRDRGLARRRAEDAVRLSRDPSTGRLRYEGDWFTLDSSAADPLTREAIVRLEQLFEAFEILLPVTEGERGTPSRDSSPRLVVRICGTDAEYRDVQRSLGASVSNPAIFVPEKRLLVAGGDFPHLVEEHETAAESLTASELELAAQDREIEPILRDLTERLEHQGVPAGQRAEIVRRARARHTRERQETAERIAAARRNNGQQIAAARKRFHERLAHEAWHAHAHRVAEKVGEDGSLPVWLDEGLAQVFETAVLEVGDLRLDAADPGRLDRLKKLLTASDGRRLPDVLRLGAEAFLVGHEQRREASEQAYLVAWGLALHVVMLEPVLDRAAVRRLMQTSASADPVRQFETLVGMPIDRFEPAWRTRMLALGKTSRATAPGVPP